MRTSQVLAERVSERASFAPSGTSSTSTTSTTSTSTNRSASGSRLSQYADTARQTGEPAVLRTHAISRCRQRYFEFCCCSLSRADSGRRRSDRRRFVHQRRLVVGHRRYRSCIRFVDFFFGIFLNRRHSECGARCGANRRRTCRLEQQQQQHLDICIYIDNIVVGERRRRRRRRGAIRAIAGRGAARARHAARLRLLCRRPSPRSILSIFCCVFAHVHLVSIAVVFSGASTCRHRGVQTAHQSTT